VAQDELERARRSFRGSMESARAWRGFTDQTRHHDMTYWTLLVTLFVEPGMNRMTLIERIIDFAAVSRSTAERAIREARECGYIVDEPAGKEVRYRLSERLFEHCIEFFRHFMDLERVLKDLDRRREETGA
jgi:hypothetical protein